MGVRHLESFIQNNVYNGYVGINMEIEIKKYYSTSTIRDPPAPIIVIDLMSLYNPITQADILGLLCGGRFNHVVQMLEKFFARFLSLGAKLTFFYDGPVQQIKYDTYIERQNEKYCKMITIIDAIDRGLDIIHIKNKFQIMQHTLYPLVRIAKKYGEVIVSIAKECDQELVTYANKVHAFAIISNDTDFLIFKGMWRYWAAKDINFETLNTMEYSRLNLVRQLKLSFKMMPLLATLGGNDFIKYEEVRNFHRQLGNFGEKFPRLADFVRRQAPPKNLRQDRILHDFLFKIFGKLVVNEDFKKRFVASLEFYETDHLPVKTNANNDPIKDLLLNMTNTFILQIWNALPYNITNLFVDMRKGDVGVKYPHLAIKIVTRQAGIILFHQQMLRDCSTITIVIKMSHEASYAFETVPVEFPDRISPPPLLDLLSQRKDMQNSLLDIKLQLYAWIASDKLNYRLLQSVPDQLLSTVLTLYFLVENQIINIAEADAFLLVAHDVAFQTFETCNVKYPKKLEKRPFRLVFLYQKILYHFSKSRLLFGLTEDDFLYIDGVLFHEYYAISTKGGLNCDRIKQCRIYEELAR